MLKSVDKLHKVILRTGPLKVADETKLFHVINLQVELIEEDKFRTIFHKAIQNPIEKGTILQEEFVP